jgi:antigen flippase
MTTVATPVRVEVSLWRPMVLAMGKTGGGSIVSGLLSALGTKIIATMLGPSSIALLQTLQQLRDGAVTAATANGRTAVVQGASALEGIERREYLRTVAMLFTGGTFLVAMAIMVYPGAIARWSRLPASSQVLLPWLAVTVALLSVFVFLNAILNALREIGKLALLQLVSPVVAAMVAWPLAAKARSGHPVAIALFLLIPAAVTMMAAAIALRAHRDQLHEWFRGSGRWWSGAAALGFLSISGAMVVSSLAATTVLLVLRGNITRSEGLTITGQFDAAWNISMTQATLILGSVQAYYLPSLAAAKSADERVRQIRGMFLVATLATMPIIVALVALKPLAVSVLYSRAFLHSPGFLRWTLIGDYLKVSSWVLAAPMLAMREAGSFLGLDLLTQAIFLGVATSLVRVVRPAESVAIAFLVSYAFYFSVCYVYVRTRHGFRFGRTSITAWLTGLALIIGVSTNAWTDTTVHSALAVVWVFLAIGFSAGFAWYIRRTEE